MDERLKKQRRGWLKSYLWSAPSLALIALIVVFPILYTFFISLTNMNVYHWFDFTIIGLDNYVKALFVFDSGFLSALINTVLWTVVNMAIQLVLAFVLASLLNIQKLRARKLYKTLLMFPWAMPGYVSILLWKTGMFNTEFGLLNQWMEKLGLEAQRWLMSRRGQQWEPVRFRMAGRKLLRLWLRWDTAVRMRFGRCVRLRMCRRMMWKVF